MHQTLFFLPNGIAHSGQTAPVSRCRVAAIGTCLPGQSRAIKGSDSKPCADTLAKPQTLDLSRFSAVCDLPCSEVLSTILRDPSRFACFLSNALCFCPVMCLFFRHTRIRRIFLPTRIRRIFLGYPVYVGFLPRLVYVGFFDAQCSYGKSK